MKKISICLIVYTIVLLVSVSGYCEDNKVKLYFGNGMLNDLDDAKDSLSELLTEIESRVQGTELAGKIEYEISHNKSGGFFKDFFESTIQNIDTTSTKFWRYLAGLDVVPDFFQNKYKEHSAAIDKAMVSTYPEIVEHIKKYNDELCSGNKVVVVGHSQGNLFANIAYEGINESVINGFGVVAVATPDTYVAGNGPYTTIMEDQVIGIIPGALIRNLDNFDSNVNFFDWSGHKFIDSYLAQQRPAETKILNDVVDTINNLEWPTEGSCTKELALITLYPGSGEEVCFVWDIRRNKYAEFLDDDDNPVVFPIQEDRITRWRSTTYRVGKELYSSPSQCKDTSFLMPANCYPPGGEGTCTATTSVESTCQDLYGQPLMNESTTTYNITVYDGQPWFSRQPADYLRETKTIKRTHYGLRLGKFPSYKDFKGTLQIKIQNNINEYTTVRAQAVTDSIYLLYDRNDYFRVHEVRETTDAFEVITPIGSFDIWRLKWFNNYNYNWPDWDDFHGEYFNLKIG